jgi:hypothetical protein
MVQAPPAGDSTSRIEHTSAWLQVVAGVLAVAVAVLGIVSYHASQEKSDAQRTAGDLASDNESLQRDMDATKAKMADINAQLDATKADLERSQKALTNAGLPPPTPAGDGGGTVRRQGTLTLTTYYCADLDSTASDWHVNSGCGGAENDIRNYFGISAGQSADLAVVANANAPDALTTCQALSGYAQSIAAKSVVKGLKVCFRTTAKNHALLRVDSGPDETDSSKPLVFSVIVWNG